MEVSRGNHSFILNPVCATAHVTRNCSERPLNSRKTPRITCDLTLDSIPLELSDRQYRCLAAGGRTLHQVRRNLKYWKWRPAAAQPVYGHERLWWRYAIACHRERIRERNESYTWEVVLRKCGENVKYVRAFKAHLDNPVTLDAELKSHMEKMDRTRSYDELKALREAAVSQLRREKHHVDDDGDEGENEQAALVQVEDGKELEKQGIEAKPSDKTPPRTPAMLRPDWSPHLVQHGSGEDGAPGSNVSTLEEELLELMAADGEGGAGTLNYKDVVFARIGFSLRSASVRLHSEDFYGDGSDRQLAFECEFDDVRAEVETRPRTKSYKFGMTLGGLSLRDCVTTGTSFPLLISSQGSSVVPSKDFWSPEEERRRELAEPLFYLLYETRPFVTRQMKQRIDFRFHLRSQPLNIVYNPAVFRRVSDFFRMPEEDELGEFGSLDADNRLNDELLTAALERIEAARQRTKEELVRSLSSLVDVDGAARSGGKRVSWDVSVELSASQILVPEDLADKEALIMAVDLGKFHLTNGDGEEEGEGEARGKENQEEKSTPAPPSEKDAGEEEDSDEEFVTPASSPGSPAAASQAAGQNYPVVLFPGTPTDRITAASVRSALLLRGSRRLLSDRFKVTMTGMQVTVGRVKDHDGQQQQQGEKGESRILAVDFNTLEISFNLQTWIVILDNLGIRPSPTHSARHPPPGTPRTPKTSAASPAPPKLGKKLSDASSTSAAAAFDTEVDVKVKALAVVLSKVASIQARQFSARLNLTGGDFAIGGRLGDFSIRDLTEEGALYRDRFLSRGEDLLSFHFFKYGGDDEKLERPYEAFVKLRMSSIIYVHTHRFYSEFLTFFNQFHQLQIVMHRAREAAAGGTLKEMTGRGSRVMLDVEAGSPLLLIPMSSHSTKMLAVDMGSLEIHNTFKFSGDEGTISSSSLSTATVGDLGSLSGGPKFRGPGSARSFRSWSSQQRQEQAARSAKGSTGRSRRARTASAKRRSKNPSSVADDLSTMAEGGGGSDSKDDSLGPLRSLAVTPAKCLLDVLFASLADGDLKTAERLSGDGGEESDPARDLAIGSYVVRLGRRALLKEKFHLKLHIERNLDKAFCNRVPDLSVKGALSKLHAAVDAEEYMLIRGLLTYNLGENLDDLNFPDPTSDFEAPHIHLDLTGSVWTCIFMDFELQDVILDVVIQHEDPPHRPEESALARIDFFKSRLVFESFSDGSRDVDLVSREILLSDLRFVDCPANKRANVFSQILRPMEVAERNNPLQAEVHFRATQDTNRFTILLNNMRLMGIFDWWLAVLDFINKAADNPAAAAMLVQSGRSVSESDEEESAKKAKKDEKTMIVMQEEPLYPSAGVISRRAPVVESKGPVFELKLNITDSELMIVADSSQPESPTVILRSTTVVAFRPDMVDRPFSCNLNNAEVFSCVLGREEESALSIIDPVTINFEIGGRTSGGGVGTAARATGGLADATADESVERTAEIQLQQLNIRLSYHDWIMFSAILESFPRQAREAIYGRESPDPDQQQSSVPTNVQVKIGQLQALGFRREDCARALSACDGIVDEAALWLTTNASPASASAPSTPKKPERTKKKRKKVMRSRTTSVQDPEMEPMEELSDEDEEFKSARERNTGLDAGAVSPPNEEADGAAEGFLAGTPVSFAHVELKMSSANLCVIDDCRDADVPLFEAALAHVYVRHSFRGDGVARAAVSGSYYNRALSSWEPFVEPWRCRLDWKVRAIGQDLLGRRLSANLATSDVVNVSLTSTLLELYHTVKANWTEDYYGTNGGGDPHLPYYEPSSEPSSSAASRLRRRVPFVPFALRNDTGSVMWFCTQTRMSGSSRRPSGVGPSSSSSSRVRDRIDSGEMNQGGQSTWRQVEVGETIPFTFEERAKLRHVNSHDMKIHQISVRVGDWQEVSAVSVDRVGTYFRHAEPVPMSALDYGGTELPPARIVFDVTLDGSARKLITVRSALLVRNKLPQAIDLRLENTAMRIGDVKEMSLGSGETRPIPLGYVWSRIFAKPSPSAPPPPTSFSSASSSSASPPQWRYCQLPVNWYHIMTKQDNSLAIHSSKHGWDRRAEKHRFAVSVRRQNYPLLLSNDPDADFPSAAASSSSPTPESGARSNPSPSSWIQPAHLITFLSPVVVVNLLPCHLNFRVREQDTTPTQERKTVPSADAHHHQQHPQPQHPSSIKPGKETWLPVDTSRQLVLTLSLDQYPGSADVILPANCAAAFDARVRVTDAQDRSLFLQVRVSPVYRESCGAVSVRVYAPMWLVNKTGLPLVFRQEGYSVEAAGQDVEHEVARMGSPLMFSFMEREGVNQSITMRIGNGLHTDGKATWCRHFYIQLGANVRRLRVSPRDGHRPEWVYTVGVEVRAGNGRYRNTVIVTLAPRFQLYNQSSHRMVFSQSCYAATVADPAAEATHLVALPQSSLAFHWPRLDRDQLLSVRLLDVPHCQWSGCFGIEGVSSFHLTVRDADGRGNFIRVEISLLGSGATFSIVITDAGDFPPPFRIDNFSEVPITFYQAGVRDETFLRSVVKPHHSLPYAWDEPNLPPYLTCTAPGGSSAFYNMNVLGEGSQLTYENFIYISLTATFASSSFSSLATAARAGTEGGPASFSALEGQELVLDVEGTRVFLGKKQAGKRSQLWRMTPTGMLQHEGSSPPQDPPAPPEMRHPLVAGASASVGGGRHGGSGGSAGGNAQLLANLNRAKNVLVLDIAGPAVQPTKQVPLMLRKPDERRQLTQRWRFTHDGRLMSAHNGLFVQAKDGFEGLHRGSEVVLGPPAPVCYLRIPPVASSSASSSSGGLGVPVEQAISRQRLRPGSGFLSLRVITEGPTRVLQISDVKQKRSYAKLDERDWVNVNDEKKRPDVVGRQERGQPFQSGGGGEREFQIVILAKAGIGLSLVSKDPHPEELLYAFLSNVVVDYQTSSSQCILDGSVQNVQVDNQLADAQCPVVMYLSPSSKSDEHRHLPAIHFTANKSTSGQTENSEIYKHLMVTVKNMTLALEEELLLKTLKFLGLAMQSDRELERAMGADESAYEAQRALMIASASANATRYYFGNLKLTLNQIRLSVSRSPKQLPPDLKATRRKLGLSLITFEDANIELDPFVRTHPFETFNFLTGAVIQHYRDELLSQAIQILGSTDFLGNPIGLLNDLSEGISGLVSDGNVGGLIKNVAHGAANSAAKVTGSLSDGLSKATVVSKYDERRLMIRRQQQARGLLSAAGPGERSREHLVAGIKGLGFGVLGGLTSMVTETYDGVTHDGVSGFFTGLGWGLVGTISKPAIGVLDFASGTATAIREANRSSSRRLPKRLRPARLVVGPGGSMPAYSERDASGQELLYRMNGRDFSEIFVAHEQLRSGEEDLQVLVTSERVLIFSTSTPSSASASASSSSDSTAAATVSPVLSRHLLTVSHKNLLSARPVVDRPQQQQQEQEQLHPHYYGGVSRREKHYVEILVGQQNPDGSEAEAKRPQVRCDTEKIARTVARQINYARTMFEERTQAVPEEDGDGSDREE